jgi:hypothetical protein
MRYLSLLLVLLFSMCQQPKEVKRFEIPELGFSFEEPGWHGVKNENFTDTLRKYNWNIRTAITESTNSGGIEIIKYYKDSTNIGEREFFEISVGGLHESLQDYDKYLAFTRDTKLIVPNLKIIQPATETSISGKRAISKFRSYTVPDNKDIPSKFYDKSVNVFMGNYTYNLNILTKEEDIKVFDDLVKTIVITK